MQAKTKNRTAGFMFRDCSSLASLDGSEWNTAKVQNLYGTFYNCGRLVSVYAGSGWNTDKVSVSIEMFKECKNLSGGEGTSYSGAQIDKAYARIDGGTANPGYFSEKQI